MNLIRTIYHQVVKNLSILNEILYLMTELTALVQELRKDNSDNPDDENFLSNKEAAAFLKKDVKTLRNYREEGLPFKQMRRGAYFYSKLELIKFLKSKKDQK